MPLYEYKCLKCGKTYEAINRMSEIEPCPRCKSRMVQLLPPRRTGIIFKGKGWAKDGYQK